MPICRHYKCLEMFQMFLEVFWYSFPVILKYFRARVEETWAALPCEFEFELFPHKIFFPTHSVQFFFVLIFWVID